MAPALDGRFFVVSARAPHPYFGGYRWYEQDESGKQDLASFQMSLAILGRFVDDLLSSVPCALLTFDREPTFIPAVEAFLNRRG